MSTVMCDKTVTARWKGDVTGEEMLHGLQTVELGKWQEAELEVAGVKMWSLSFVE